MSLREELGAEDYERYALAIKRYCAGAGYDERGLCPSVRVCQRWFKELHYTPSRLGRTGRGR